MINNYVGVLKNYVGFQGRASRTEFWQYVLVNVIIGFVLGIIDTAIKSQILGGIYDLAVLLPSLAVLTRRLHDTDRTAWWLLLYIVIFIGWIVLIVFAALEGTPGDNKYGPNPNGAAGGYPGGGYPQDQAGYPAQGGYPNGNQPYQG
jgi:uncharacterized membrane protein YhaH (DUF805 family)